MAINLGGADLPKQWVISKLPEFTDVVMGQSPPSDTYNLDSIGLPFFQGKSEFGAIYPTINKYCSVPNRIADEGATLLSVRAPVGPTNLANTRCCIGRGLAAIHPMGGMDSMFILLLFRSIEINLSGEGTGTTFKAITKAYVDELKFAIAPLNEQKRIVAKIEELFSELDNGIAALKTAREQLKVYRQAVLKHAFEGKLTEQWRKDNADKLESPEQLLARIQQEREARYQHQLEEWKAAVKAWEGNGKEAKRPRKPEAPPSLARLESSLPYGWLTVSLDWLLTTEKKPMMTGPFGTALRKSEHQPDGVPVLGIENIGNGKFIPGNKIFVAEGKAEELATFKVHPGEIVISRSGTVGEICEVPEKVNNALISTNLLRVSLDNNVILSPFFVLMFQGGGVKLQVKELCKGSSREFLNQSILKSIKYPVCGLEEQKALLEQLAMIFSNIEQQEREVALSLEKAETLRQSILRKAFSGQLVPQDPNDEPASELLARIQAEKAAKKAEPKAAAKPKAVRKPRAKRSTQSTEATT